MKRPFPTYLLAVVIPSTVVLGATLARVRSAWSGVRQESDARVARMALQVFQQELGQATDTLLARAEPSELDPSSPTVARAIAGDTVTGMRGSADAPELFVLAPPRAGDPQDRARYASGRLLPGTPSQVGRATGYQVALYLRGRRWAASDGAAAPDTLSTTTLEALGKEPHGLPLPPSRGGGVVAGLGSGFGAIPGMAAWARPRAPVPGPVPLPLFLVTGLLILFALVAGWIQLSARPEDRRNVRVSFLLVCLLPTLTAWGFQVQVQRLFENAARATTASDLTRALSVARAQGVTTFPETVHQLTGFHATLIRAGKIASSTFAMAGPSVASIPVPPGSFTTSGRVVTPEGPSAYVALGLADGGLLVTTAPEPLRRVQELGRELGAFGIALATWLLMAGVFVGVRRRRPSGS